MSAEIAFTAVYDSVEGGLIQARLVEIPGVITVASTIEEATTSLVDAFAEYLRSFADEAVPRLAGTRVNVSITTA